MKNKNPSLRALAKQSRSRTQYFHAFVKTLVPLLLAINISHAYANTSIPDELLIREHWISLTKSYDIEAGTKKLGTLYRRFLSVLLTYDFYDPKEVKTATAKASFFSFGAHLDVYDAADTLIGSVDEKIFTVFPTFDIFAKDSSTRLARAEMNFWGTKFSVYDPATDKEMAVMSRSYFRLKNDWTINVTNRALLEKKNIDSRLLITVLSVQGEIEDWKKDHSNGSPALIASLPPTVIGAKQSKPSEKELEALANTLEEGFKTAGLDYPNQKDAERAQAFVSYCLEQANQDETQRKGIVTLLKLRLQGHV